MQKRLTVMLACVCLLGSTLLAQTTFKNPILTGMNPDPSICRVGDDFYLITSTFEYFPGIPIYQSKDLVHWKLIGYVLSRNSNNPLLGANSSNGGQYAPTIRYYDSTFYVTCTNYGGQGSQGAFYVTAKNPAGSWSDPHWVNNWGVDPSLLFDNDSIYYVYPNSNQEFLLTTINPATGKFAKSEKRIATGLGGSSPEGPHLYKIKDYYYLMSAEGGTGYDHREVIQKSKSIWGPYTASPVNPVVSHRTVPGNAFQAIGHADLVQLKDSSWWLVCLGIRPKGGNYHHLGRETFLAPVTWNADDWPKVGTDGIIKEEFPVPNLPEHLWEKEPVRDNFDSINLNLMWNFVRNPYSANWSLTEKPGFLRLKGSKLSFKEKDSPAFICRRQTAFNMVASAKISFSPVAPNEEAGLVVRGDDYNHYDLLITQLAGKRVVMLRKVLQEKVKSLNYAEISDGDVVLRVSATDLEYKFWVQEEGKTAVLLGSDLTRNLSTEVIGGFTGTFIGMYASGNGSANVNPADFDWFDFEEDPAKPYSWSIGPKDSLNNMVTPQIISISSSAFDNAEITWNNITNETGYLIERLGTDIFDSVGTTQANDTVFTDNGLSGNTMYLYRIKAKNNYGFSNYSLVASVITMPKPGPFSGTPAQLPGKIQAEDYDYGLNNIAYYDLDAKNNGGKYRNDGVDIESCWDTDNGYNIGFVNNDEWLIYTVDVNDSVYDIQLRVGSPSGGSVWLYLDGKEIASITIPATGDWQTWKTVTINNIRLEQGKNKKLKILMGSGLNFNWINFSKNIKSIVNEIDDKDVSFYPNPNHGVFQINQNINLEFSKIDFFSVSGKLEKTIEPVNPSFINITDLINGLYIGKLYSKSHQFLYLKILKN